MLADDQGWGDLGLTGNRNLSTPHIDTLAQSGVFFEHFYVQPLCAPTRAELLTGRYYPRTGVRGVSRRAECMNLDEVTLADRAVLGMCEKDSVCDKPQRPAGKLADIALQSERRCGRLVRHRE